MFKLGIFEDERIILNSICNYITWQDFGCELVCSSYRGTDIKELIKIHQPDIIITDIQMGDINGLDICDFLQKEYPDTQKIIITGFGNMEYAKRAIKSSVVDFILKPIDRNELTSAVKKAVEHLSLLQSSEETQKHVELQKIERFLMEIASEQYLPEQPASDWLEETTIKLHTYFCLGIYIEQNRDNKKGMDFIQYWKNAMTESEAMIPFQLKYLFYISRRLYIIFDAEKECSQNASYLYNTINTHALHHCEQYTELTKKKVFMVYSDIYWYTADLFSCIHQVNQLFEQRFFLEQYSLLHNIRISHLPTPDLQKPLDCFYPLVDAIISNNRKELNFWFLKMQQLLRTYSEEEVKFKYIEFFIYLKEHLVPYRINIEDLMSTDQLISAFVNRYSFSQINTLISNILEVSFNQREENIKSSQSMSAQVRRYIEKNYSNPLSVKIIAAEFNYNPKYLSAVVKKEAGISINDLIMETRIQNAIIMLKNPTIKTYSVAEKVGIPDARYFSQLFKKMTGMTPSEYRKRQV